MKIVPCPFCGDPDPAIDEVELGIFAICCNSCRAIGPHWEGEQTSITAIVRWNARGTPEEDAPLP